MMAFKFAVGDTVVYQTLASKETLFQVVQQMPGEDRQSEPRYKIKAVGEGYERVVSEGELNTQFEDSQTRERVVRSQGGAGPRRNS